MKRWLLSAVLTLLLLTAATVSAAAVTNDTVKVGLYYSSSALSSVNAEYDDTTANAFTYGYYTAQRRLIGLGSLNEDFLTVTADEEKVRAASRNSAYIICTSAGIYDGEGELPSFGDTALGVLNREGELLLVFDYEGLYSLALKAESLGSADAETWCKGCKYYGGFVYERAVGGAISVYNMVDIEDYVRCVLPYEMSNDWPSEALKAQAVCARTYAYAGRHTGFDVCGSTHCQSYRGIDARGHDNTDAAAAATSGECMYYDGDYAIGYYYSCNGGASESAKNVWGSDVGYLIGKTDPYEAWIASSVSGYSYTVSYTAAALTSRLQSKGYSIGTVKDMYVSATSPTGNVLAVTVTDTAGKSITLKQEKCRTVLGANSQRFTVNGETAGINLNVNGTTSLSGMEGVSVISGSGTVTSLSDAAEIYVMTGSGKEKLGTAFSASDSSDRSGDFIISGTGSGHNVGMSQWGAYAMAKQGYTYTDILTFYYTDITIG